MRHVPLFLLLVFFLLTQVTFAQSKFSDNPEEFMVALEEKMTKTKRPDLIEAFEVFKSIYRTGAWKPDDILRISKVCNHFDAHRLSVNPYYRDYINAVTAAKTDRDTLLFVKWHTVAEETIGNIPRGKTKPLSSFLKFSQAFLNNRAFLNGRGGDVTWRVRGGKFQFSYKEDHPELFLEQTTLVGTRKNDSLEIVKTTGVYLPLEETFKGTGGKVSWERVGLDSSIYAVLSSFELHAKKPKYTCEDVDFFYPLYFPKGGLKGRFEDNITISNKTIASSFPVFESFDKSLEIGKIGEGISYRGGFLMRGSSIQGYGSFEKPAELRLFNTERKPVFLGIGQLFIIRHEESIIAENVEGKLIMGQDSIVHPSIKVKIDIKKGIIDLNRGEKATDRNPFYSTYYNMSLDANKITWFLAEDSLDIGSRTGLIGGIEQSVTFESRNFFDASEYAAIQNVSSRNPIASLLLLFKENRDEGSSAPRFINDTRFAQKMNTRWDYSNAQTILAELTKKGFVRYYFDRHIIEILPKSFHYAAASQGKVDFDNIKLISKTNKANAQLDLKTKETKVNNIKNVEFSPKQKVAARILDEELTLLKNRNMRFSGTLYAGLSSVVAKDMEFDYDKFLIAFDSSLYLDFFVNSGEVDRKGNPVAASLNSTIEYASGFVLIDAPNNKSGKEDLPTFSSLQVKKPSYVFYDKKSIENGEYVRDSFYFELKPFPFNGLDSYGQDKLNFKGKLVSSEIFPDFEEQLVVREKDQSYGFVHTTPTNGYPTYQAQGNYTGELDLSNRGLWGRGKVEYLTADVDSEDILFKPRQMTCTAKEFFMDEERSGTVKTPQAKGQDVAVDWKPYRDSMYVRTKGTPFELFKEPGYTHQGMFILTPSGLKGRGTFEWDGGILKSKLIEYGPFQAESDTADLKIKSLEGADIVFDSRNIDGKLDFDRSIGNFKANSDSAATFMPFDQYRTSMNEFTWDMKGQTIRFKSEEGKLGKFLSTDPNRDSLEFSGKTAFYDMKTNELKVGGVPFVKSADAYIYSQNGDIAIEPGGRMADLVNAKIEADTVTKYHVIKRATVKVQGKKDYTAEGFYEYNIPGYDQEIFFDNIVGSRYGGGKPSEKNVKTTAQGSVDEDGRFRMDIKTLFKGDIILNSNEQNLRFEGYAQLDALSLRKPQWFTVRGETDKKKPIVEIKAAKNEDDDPLYTGFYVSKDNGMLYPRILKPPFARVDREILAADEMMRYDAAQNQFIFGDSTKILNPKVPGKEMVLNDNTGQVVGTGPLSIGAELQYMEITAAGEIRSNMTTDSAGNYATEADMMTGMEFIFPKELYEFIITDLRAGSFDANSVLFSNQFDFYKNAMPTFLPSTKALMDAQALLKSNQFIIPKKDNKYAFLLGKHTVKWNSDYQSFVSMSNKIPLISVNGEPINKSLTMYTEYKMPGSDDDRWYLYLKVSADLWYFFGYQAGVMNVTSSSTRFNDALLAMKKKQMVHKMPDGETYEIIPVEAVTGQRFVNRVKEGRN